MQAVHPNHKDTASWLICNKKKLSRGWFAKSWCSRFYSLCTHCLPPSVFLCWKVRITQPGAVFHTLMCKSTILSCKQFSCSDSKVRNISFVCLYVLCLEMTQVRRWQEVYFAGSLSPPPSYYQHQPPFNRDHAIKKRMVTVWTRQKNNDKSGWVFYVVGPFLSLEICGDEQFSTMVTRMRGMSIQWVVMAMPEKNGGLVQLVLWADGKTEMSFWWLEVLVVGLSACYQGYPLLMPCKPTRGGQKNPSPILWLDSEPEKEKE